MLKLIKYENDKYFHTNKIVAPFIILMGMLAMSYSMAPLEILSSFSISALFLFVLMIWIGMGYNDIDYDMVEQTIFVKIRHQKYIYYSKIVMIAILSFYVTVISLVYPVFVQLKNHIFIRDIYISDIIGGFILMYLVCLSGGIMGLIFNKYIFRNRKMAIFIAALTGIISLLSGEVINEIDFLKYILWIFPPIYNITKKFSVSDVVIAGNLLMPVFMLVFYIVMEILLYTLAMQKNKYE